MERLYPQLLCFSQLGAGVGAHHHIRCLHGDIRAGLATQSLYFRLCFWAGEGLQLAGQDKFQSG